MLALEVSSRRLRSDGLTARDAVRARVGVDAVLLALAGVAWWVSVDRMTGMFAGPGTALGALPWFVGIWATMMAAMMLPSLVPAAAVVATLAPRRARASWVLFAAGYLVVWSAAGVAAYGLLELGRSLFGGTLGWSAGGRWLTAGVLALAALYQVSPAKDVCLGRCRAPERVLRAAWRDGPAGAMTMGARNATWCLGCTWALMAALFALGVMSITWMAVVAALVALEKAGPSRRAARMTTAGVLTALALAIAAAPHEVPGFVVPGPAANHSMSMMR
jgi:predicted metal-binding membrane protein